MKTTSAPITRSASSLCALLVAATIPLAADPADASLLISDSFAYGEAGGNLEAVTATGSTGLTGNWTYATPAEYWTYLSLGGLSFGSYGSSGGAAGFSGSNFAPSVAQRQLTSALSTGTYYLGYLFSITSRANDGSVGSLLLGPSGQNGNSSPAGIFSDEFGTNVGGSRIAMSDSLNSGTASASNGTTYLSLNQVTLTGTTISIDRYILTLDQFEYFNSLGGGLDANLNPSIATGTGSTNVFQKGTQSVSNGTTTLPFLSIEGYANNGAYDFIYDEVRLSDTGFNALPVPEPSSAVLFGGAALALAGLVRQRRSPAARG